MCARAICVVNEPRQVVDISHGLTPKAVGVLICQSLNRSSRCCEYPRGDATVCSVQCAVCASGMGTNVARSLRLWWFNKCTDIFFFFSFFSVEWIGIQPPKSGSLSFLSSSFDNRILLSSYIIFLITAHDEMKMKMNICNTRLLSLRFMIMSSHTMPSPIPPIIPPPPHTHTDFY